MRGSRSAGSPPRLVLRLALAGLILLLLVNTGPSGEDIIQQVADGTDVGVGY